MPSHHHVVFKQSGFLYELHPSPVPFGRGLKTRPILNEGLSEHGESRNKESCETYDEG
jgi:hypothetical protein